MNNDDNVHPGHSMATPAERAEEARLVAEGNSSAARLETIMFFNPDVRMPSHLFRSACPRVCLPLPCQKDARNVNWADGIRAVSDNCVGEAMLLASKRSDVGHSGSMPWKNTYNWWYGADEACDGSAVQRSVIEALGFDDADVLTNQVRIPRTMCFIEGTERMWLFFTDGRYDFTKAMSALGAEHPFGSAQEYADLAKRNPKMLSVSRALKVCNELVVSGKLFEKLNSMKPAHGTAEDERAFRNFSRTAGLSREQEALRVHEPRNEEERTAAMAEASGVPFTRISCSRTVGAAATLLLPSPLHRSAIIEEDVAVLKRAEALTDNMAEALAKYSRMRDFTQAESLITNNESSGEGDGEFDAEAAEAAREEGLARGSSAAAKCIVGDLKMLEAAAESNGSTKSVRYTVSFNEDEARQFMNGELDNPQVSVSTSQKGFGRKKSHTFDGRFFDIFSDVDAEMRALKEGGIGALEEGLNGEAEDVRQANETLRKVDTMQSNGAAMRAKFEAKDCFWQYRRENGEQIKQIKAAHTPGSAEYCEAMQSFKRTACQRVLDACLGNSADAERTPSAIREAFAALRKQRVQIPEIPYLCEEMGPFGNYIYSMRTDLDVAYAPGPTIEDVELCVYTAMAGAWHHENLRPNILLAGAHSVGKSYTLQIAMNSVPDGVGYACTHETARAGLTDEMRTNLLQTFEELPLHHIAIDQYGKPREVDSTEKDRLTNIYRTTVSIEITKDPETGKTDRKTVVYHACEEMARQAATNSKMPETGNAALARWCVRNVTPYPDMEHAIRPKIGALKCNNPPEETKMIIDDIKKMNTLIMLTEKAIQSHAIADVNMHAMTEMHKMLDFVMKEYNFNTEDPKMYVKIAGVARLLTVRNAVYMAACSEHGRDFRVNPMTKKPQKLRDVGVELLLEIEKFLVTTREIVVYTFSLMRSEWMPTLRQEILQTIRDLYISGREGFDNNRETNIDSATKRKRSMMMELEFCSPMHSTFSRFREAEGYEDRSCIRLKDENGSTHIGAVAKFIARNIRTRVVEPEMVRRELVAMQSVMVTGPIWVQAVGSSVSAAPFVFETANPDPQASAMMPRVQPQQKKPLFFCGRVPHAAGRSVANGAQSSSFRSSSADAMGGFGSSDGNFGRESHDQFACMIMYEALKNPADHRSIVRKSVEKLSHRHMVGNVQTFVTSLFTEIDVEYPDFTEFAKPMKTDSKKRRRGTNSRARSDDDSAPPPPKHNKRMHHLIIPELPTLITIRADRRQIGTMNNERPLKPGQKMRASSRLEFERGEFSSRVQHMPSADVYAIPYDTDADHVALMLHQKEIGVPLDYSYHWINMRRTLIEKRKRYAKEAGKVAQFVEYSKIEHDYEAQWSTRYMTQQMIALCKDKNTSMERVDEINSILIETNGRASSVVNGSRLLTDIEVEMKRATESLRNNLSRNPTFGAQQHEEFDQIERNRAHLRDDTIVEQVEDFKETTCEAALRDDDDDDDDSAAEESKLKPRIDSNVHALDVAELHQKLSNEPDEASKSQSPAKKRKSVDEDDDERRDNMLFGEEAPAPKHARPPPKKFSKEEMKTQMRAEFLRRSIVLNSSKNDEGSLSEAAKTPALNVDQDMAARLARMQEKARKKRDLKNGGGGGGVFDDVAVK